MKRLFYGIVFGTWYLISLLPLPLLYVCSDLLFPIVYYLIQYRRLTVRENLEQSFPEMSLKEKRELEKKFYHFFCDYIVETIKQFTISKKEMKRRMVFRGLDEAAAELRQSDASFAFLYLGHYCNWEWISSLTLQMPDEVFCGQIYHPLRNPAFDRLFLRLRGRFGAESITMTNTLRRILELKRQGRKAMIGFISDQLPKWPSIHFFTPFLHRDTAVFTGAEQIGRKVGAVYYFLDIERPRRGYYVCTFRRMPPVEGPAENYGMTAAFMTELEKMIRRNPEYWLWTHKRWKRTKEDYMAVAEQEPDPQARIVKLMQMEWLRDHADEWRRKYGRENP